MLKTLALGIAASLLAAPAIACSGISSAVVALTGCVDEEWVPGEKQGAQEFAYLTADQNFGLMVITEKVAFPITAFRDAILANAVAAVGGKADQVAAVGERIENVSGKAWNVLEYTVANNGNPILFQNFYYSQPGFGSVQILAYSLASDAAAAGYKAGIFAATVHAGN